MAANKFLSNISGKIKEVFGLVVSTGAPDANKIVALDSTGKLDVSVMPAGVAAEVISAITSENLIAGDFVNLYLNGGVSTLRKADSTTNTKPANGFVIVGSTSPASNTMYILGISNTFVTGLTIGTRYFLDKTVPGGVTSAVNIVSGNIIQELGIATLTTSILTFDNPNWIEVA